MGGARYISVRASLALSRSHAACHSCAPPLTCLVSLALSFLGEDLLLQLDDLHLSQAQAVRRPAQLNIAACQLRQVGARCRAVLTGGSAGAAKRRG